MGTCRLPTSPGIIMSVYVFLFLLFLGVGSSFFFWGGCQEFFDFYFFFYFLKMGFFGEGGALFVARFQK